MVHQGYGLQMCDPTVDGQAARLFKAAIKTEL